MQANDIVLCSEEVLAGVWGWREVGPVNYDMAPTRLARTGDKPSRWMKAEGGVAFVSKPMFSADMVTEVR